MNGIEIELDHARFCNKLRKFTLVGKELDDQGDVPCEKALVFLDGRK